MFPEHYFVCLIFVDMADVEEPKDSRFDDVDLESILARVERRGPLTFTRKRCLYRGELIYQLK